MRVATASQAPVAGPMLEERLTGLYRRKQVVENLIRSLEQYGRFQQHHGNLRIYSGEASAGAKQVTGLLRQ